MKIETTIRRAQAAVGLILSGAISHIGPPDGPDENLDRQLMTQTLFDCVHGELDDWGVTTSWRNMDNMLAKMHAALAPDSDVPDIVREWIRTTLATVYLLP